MTSRELWLAAPQGQYEQFGEEITFSLAGNQNVIPWSPSLWPSITCCTLPAPFAIKKIYGILMVV
jgi:hypothetical protein